ncbi:MAG: hypothetical protein ACLQJF_21115 [Candidatus Sulfotelmatobacter sp.]|jgi:hypothetical protein
MNNDTFIPDTAELATLDLDAYPQGKLLVDTVQSTLLRFGRFQQSEKGEECDIIPTHIEHAVNECLDLLNKNLPDAELVEEVIRITRAYIRTLTKVFRWRDKNPRDAYCKQCRRKQDVIHQDTENLTLTLECGHTRKYPKYGVHRSKETWTIEHPTKVTAETAPVGIVNGSDNQVDDTGQQYHDPGYDIGNDPFGFAIEGVSRYGNGAEDAIIAKLDELKAASRDCLVISCIGADNYRWLTDYYGRLNDGTLSNADHQKCSRLFEKIRNSLRTP